MAYYINVMRVKNWEVDKKNGLKLIGVSEKRLKFAQRFVKGDYIVTYVSSPKSSFAGLREVAEEGVKATRKDLGYDDIYNNYVVTKSIKILEEENWVPIRGILNELELTKGRKHWMNLLMPAFREISERDFKLIVSKMDLPSSPQLNCS